MFAGSTRPPVTGIIRLMPVRRLHLQRLTAPLLPAALLWLWAACAAICGQEAAEHSAGLSSTELIAVEGAPECECPFAAFPAATAPDTRAALDAGSQAPPTAPTAAPAVAPSFQYSIITRARGAPPPATPPLALLSTLRI